MKEAVLNINTFEFPPRVLDKFKPNYLRNFKQNIEVLKNLPLEIGEGYWGISELVYGYYLELRVSVIKYKGKNVEFRLSLEKKQSKYVDENLVFEERTIGILKRNIEEFLEGGVLNHYIAMPNGDNWAIYGG